MRLISQDGCTDIPYEQFTIMLDANASYRVILAVSDKMEIAMASYSTSAKALDVLKQMREAYKSVVIMVNDDVDKETLNKMHDMIKNNHSFVLAGKSSAIEKVAACYRFPQDEEV